MATQEMFPLPNKKGKNRSNIWDHFGFRRKDPTLKPTEDNLNMDFMYCNYCYKKYKNHKATTTMRFHLDQEHKDVHYKASETADSSADKKETAQPKITSFSSGFSQSVRSNLTIDKKDRIETAMMSLFVDKMLPLSVLEHYSFTNMVRELEPRFKIPGRKAMYARMTVAHGKAKIQLRVLLDNSTNVALTHDAWTSLHTESYDTITAHFISPEWELHSAVLSTFHFKGSHTGENISTHLDTTLKLWGIKDPVFVTDNAANEQKAIRLLGYPRVGCYGHRLNLVIKHALAHPDSARLIAKGRSIVTFFHTSTTATELLTLKQNLLLPEAAQNHRLIQDVATRWNSTLDMLKRLDEQTQALSAVVTDSTLGKRGKDLAAKVYSFEEQMEVQSLVSVLDPFKKATEMLSSDKEPTQGLILPAIMKRNRVIETKDDDSEMIASVKADMRKQLDERTKDRDVSLLACKLTPSTKAMHFASDQERITAEDLVFKELIECYANPKPIVKQEPTDENDNILPILPKFPSIEDDLEILGNPAPTKKMKTENTESKMAHEPTTSTSWLADVIFVSETKPLSPDELARNELKGYMAEPAPNPQQCQTLQWWKLNEGKYPKLSILAKKYLSIPASSVSSERVFSLTGNLISKKRSRLKPDLVDTIVFLNKNKSFLK